MPYTAEISRSNPACFLFLIDQSRSMAGRFGGEQGKSKAASVADLINRLLQTLVLRCAKSEGIRDYFHVGAIGYGGSVEPALGGAFGDRALVPVSELANNPLRVEERRRIVGDEAGGLEEQTVRTPVWVEARADGKTPMCEALRVARAALTGYLRRHPQCYPPLVVNLTDGRATDGYPLADAQALQQLASADGHVLLFNVHISARPAEVVRFPHSDSALPDEDAWLLFQMSSPLPEALRAEALAQGLAVGANARGFVFNADLLAVAQFLDIGTRVDKLMRR